MKASWRLLGVSLVAGFLSFGVTCPPQQPSVQRVVRLTRAAGDRMQLEYVSRANRVDRRRYRIFGGTAATSVRLFTRRTGVGATSPVRIFAEGNPTPIATFTSDTTGSETDVDVPGSAAVVEMDWDGGGTAPQVFVDVSITAGASLVSPPGSGALAMNLNDPVELFFSNANGDRTVYYLYARGVAGKKVDVVLDGPGRVFVSDPLLGRIVLDATTGDPLADAPTPLAVVQAASGGLVRFQPTRDTLLFTVTNFGVGNGPASRGHARFSVNEVLDAVHLTTWFNTTPPPFGVAFGGRNQGQLTTAMTAIADAASKSLYQATAGRVRIGSLKVFVQQELPSVKVDVRVDPIDQPWWEHVNGYQDMLPAVINLDEKWFLKPTQLAGRALAHEFFHYRYGLADEYRPPFPFEPQDDCPTCLCPPSMMSGLLGDELCWAGNHNPYADVALATATTRPVSGPNTSMWQFLSTKLPFTPPTTSPTRVLRRTSTVVFAPATGPGLGQPCGNGPFACRTNFQCAEGTCKLLDSGPQDPCDANRLCGTNLTCRCPSLPHPNNCFVDAGSQCVKGVPTTRRTSCTPVLGICGPPCFTDARGRCMVDELTTNRQGCSTICLP